MLRVHGGHTSSFFIPAARVSSKFAYAFLKMWPPHVSKNVTVISCIEQWPWLINTAKIGSHILSFYIRDQWYVNHRLEYLSRRMSRPFYKPSQYVVGWQSMLTLLGSFLSAKNFIDLFLSDFVCVRNVMSWVTCELIEKNSSSAMR